ncbi:MAG: phytanoyl-CoA dioxygenase family protein [Rhizomicrobium sp.]
MSVAFAHQPEPDYVGILKEQGYVIIRGLMPKTKVAQIHADMRERFEKTPFSEGDFYGPHTKRFGSLLKRSPLAAEFVQNRTILDIAEAVFAPFCDNFQLNTTQALEIWPGAPEQVPHRDQDMWQAPVGQIEYMFNVMWPFTPYRAENGATLIWPGSNRRQDELVIDRAEAISAEMDPGDAMVYLGSTQHAAGANRTDKPRTGMIIGFGLGWLKQFENQFLCYPPEVAKTFSPELARLVGYKLHRPNLGNYEGQCPSILLRDDLPEYIHSVDGLTSNQLGLLAEFRASQSTGSVIG